MLNEVIAELRELNESVPEPLRLPTPAEVDAVQEKLGIRFHPDYVRYLLEASDVVCGTLEPATVPEDSGHTYIVPMATHAWAAGLPADLVPIAEDNGDYYCMNARGEVLYWSHDGETDEEWPDLATWIEEVWIAED